MPEETPDLITGQETAKILRVSESVLSRWRALGKGPPCYRFEGAYRYDRAEVMAYLQSCRVDPAAQGGGHG